MTSQKSNRPVLLTVLVVLIVMAAVAMTTCYKTSNKKRKPECFRFLF